MKFILSTLYLVFCLPALLAQTNRDFSDGNRRLYNMYGAGSSTFNGLSLSNSLHYNVRNNEFIMDFNFNYQINNRDEFSRLKQNDRITAISAMYGRTISGLSSVLGIGIGGGFVKYVDKYIESEFVPAGSGFLGSWDDHYVHTLIKEIKQTTGIAVCLSYTFFAGRNLGIGFNFFGNINPQRSYVGAAFVLNQIIVNKKPDSGK